MIFIKIVEEEKIREIIRDELEQFIKSDRFVFYKTIQILDGRNIQVGKTTGTKIGTEGGATGQKLSVYGVTPVVQAGAISAPSGGTTQDAEARAAINSIRTALTNFGITQ